MLEHRRALLLVDLRRAGARQAGVEAARQREQFLEHLLDAAADGVVALDQRLELLGEVGARAVEADQLLQPRARSMAALTCSLAADAAASGDSRTEGGMKATTVGLSRSTYAVTVPSVARLAVVHDARSMTSKARERRTHTGGICDG